MRLHCAPLYARFSWRALVLCVYVPALPMGCGIIMYRRSEDAYKKQIIHWNGCIWVSARHNYAVFIQPFWKFIVFILREQASQQVHWSQVLAGNSSTPPYSNARILTVINNYNQRAVFDYNTCTWNNCTQLINKIPLFCYAILFLDFAWSHNTCLINY